MSQYGPGGGGYGQQPPGGGWGPPGGAGGGGYPPPDPYGGGPPGGNPYAPPAGGYDPMGGGFGGDPNAAIAKLSAPALVLMITTALGIAMQLVWLALVIAGSAMINRPEFQNGAQYRQGFMNFIWIFVALGIGAFTMFGFTKMKKGESWGLSLAAVIVSMIPCIGPCCCFSVNTFIGIWALVVLNDSQVKSAFRN